MAIKDLFKDFRYEGEIIKPEDFSLGSEAFENLVWAMVASSHPMARTSSQARRVLTRWLELQREVITAEEIKTMADDFTRLDEEGEIDLTLELGHNL